MLNVNVPNVPLASVRGFEQVDLAAFGAVQTVVTEAGAGYVRLAYDDVDDEPVPGTDAAALARGVACFTAVRAICAEHRPHHLPPALPVPSGRSRI